MAGAFWSGVRYAPIGVLLVMAALGWYSLGMPGRSHEGPLPDATSEENDLATRLKQHVVAVASVPHNFRHLDNLEKSARYLEETLTALGYEVTTQPYDVTEWTVRNIEIAIEPTGAATNTIVVGAHYDSAGDAPGANDNGSGVAMNLELARLLKNLRPTRTRLRLVFFVNEEPPFFMTDDMGSVRYAELLAQRKEPVSAMISLETLGYFSDKPGTQKYPAPFGAVFADKGNFVAFVGMPSARPLVAEVMASFRSHTDFPSIGGVAPGFVANWSDHGSFTANGFPAMMMTDTALFRYPHYHLPSDTPDKLDYGRLARLTKAVERVLRDLVKARD